MVKEGYKEVRLGAKQIEVPKIWNVEFLGNIANFKQGTQVPVDEQKYKKTEGYVRFLRIVDYTQNTDDVRYIEHPGKKYIVDKDEIIMVRYGEAGLVCRGFNGVIANNLFKIDINTDLLDKTFSYFFLKQDKVYNYLSSLRLTSAMPAINFGIVSNLKILIPSLSEQKKIASILSSVDKSIEKTDEVIEKTKELKKGLMQELLTKGVGHSEFKEVRIGPKTIKIPNVWEVKSFDEVSSVNQGLQIAISKRSKKPGPNKLKYITVQHLNNPNDSRYIYYINEPRDSVICKKEDVLMTRTGNTGEVITDERGVFHNNFFKIDFDREILNKDYLFYYLNSKFIQHVIRIFAGTTTIPDLNHGDFYSIPVLVPAKKEQKKVASILSSVDSKIQKEEEYKAKLERLKKGLMQKLLTGEIRVNTEMEV